MPGPSRRTGAAAGVVTAAGALVTAAGVLVLEEVQPEGKRRDAGRRRGAPVCAPTPASTRRERANREPACAGARGARADRRRRVLAHPPPGAPAQARADQRVLETRDRAFVTEIVYGTVRMQRDARLPARASLVAADGPTRSRCARRAAARRVPALHRRVAARRGGGDGRCRFGTGTGLHQRRAARARAFRSAVAASRR